MHSVPRRDLEASESRSLLGIVSVPCERIPCERIPGCLPGRGGKGVFPDAFPLGSRPPQGKKGESN